MYPSTVKKICYSVKNTNKNNQWFNGIVCAKTNEISKRSKEGWDAILTGVVRDEMRSPDSDSYSSA